MTREEIRKKWQEEQSVGSNAYKTALEKAKPELEKTRKRIQDKKIREAQVAVSGKVPTPSVYTKNAFANTYNAPNAVVPKQTEIQERVNKKFYETIAKTNYEQDKIETANRAFQKSQGIHTAVTGTKYDVKDKEKRDAELNQQDLDKLSVMTRKQRLDALGGRQEGTFQKAELYSQEQKNKWLEQRVNEEKGLAKLGGAMVYAGNEFVTNTLSSMGQIGATAEYIQGRDSKRKGLQYAQDYAEMTSKIGQNVENKYIQALGMATEGVGQQMPQILLGASGAGALVGGVSEFSNTFNEMILENPENKEKAFLTGVLKGTAAGLLENTMGLFGKSKLDDLAVSDIAQIKNWAKRNATAVAYDIGSEITEETLENMVGYVIDAIVNNKNLTMEQLIAETEATFKQTGLTTLLMSMLGIGGNTRTDVNNLNTRYNWIDQANVTGTQKTELKDFAKNSETTNEDLYRKTIKMEQENAVNESIYGDIVNEARLAQNQGSTMQNKTFLEKNRQTILTDEELANKQFSSEFERSAYKYGINIENESVKQVKKLTDISHNELIFDDTGFKPDQVAKYLDGKVIVNPNADPDKVIQNVVLHEVIHSKSGSKEFNDLKKTVLSFVKSKKGEYKKARLDLDNLYREAYKDRLDFDQLMDEEVITNTLGEYFGTEEKLNELINYVDNRTVLQKMYDFVKDVLNRLTGYKDQEQYFRRVERQLAKALQSDYVSKNDSRLLLEKYTSNVEFKENPEYNRYHTETLNKNVRDKLGSQLKDFVFANDYENYYLISTNNDYIEYSIIGVIPNTEENRDIIREISKEMEELYGNNDRNSKRLSEMSATSSSTTRNSNDDNIVAERNETWTSYADRISNKYGFTINGKTNNEKSNRNKRERELDNSSFFNEKFSIDTNSNGTLLALHNLNAEKLRGILELGGFPVPSIAITNPKNFDHSNYGEISVIFNKNTVNPADSRNEVYSRDGYTPRFPKIGYKINNEIRKNLKDSLRQYVTGSMYDNSYLSNVSSLLDEVNLSEKLNSNNGLDGTIENLSKNESIKYWYLKEKNIPFEEQYREQNYSSVVKNDMLQKFLDNYKGDKNTLNELNFKQIQELKTELEQLWIEENFDTEQMKKWLSEHPNYSPDLDYSKLSNIVMGAYKLNKYGSKKTLDTAKTNEVINSIANEEDVKSWLKNKFDGIVEKKGIKNSKGFYTNTGTPRSFDQLYDDYTLDNVVKIMTALDTTGTESFFGVGTNEILGTSAKKFDSIEQIKEYENELLKNLTPEQYAEYLEPINQKLKDIETSILEINPTHSNSFMAIDNLGVAIQEVARKLNGKTKLTTSRVISIMNKQGYEITSEQAQELLDFFKEARELPTQYFEAKPQRAVGFEEVASMVIPNNLDADLKQQLQDRGIKLVEYDPNIEGDRNRKMLSEEMQEYKFSVSTDTKKNIEAKIDRYTRLVEEMQQEGRDSDDWAPYANEILRLQDQLEDTRYSYQSNGAWNDFVKKYFTSEGTKTTLKDIKLPEKKITKKDFTTLIDNAQNIPEADKNALKGELKGANLTQESLKEFEQVVTEMDKAYKEQNDKILDTNKSAEEMDKIYKKYNRKHSRYDRSSLQNAKQIVPANKSGRRTKQQWLNVAKQIGTEIANKSNEEIEKIAYRTWQEERPNNRESLNRQGESFVNFESYEWVDTIYNAVKEQRAKLSIDTNKMLEQQPKKALPERKIVDEVYTEEIAEGKTRKHYQSVFESDQVGETGKEVAKELYKKDTYVPISNLDTITKTNDNIARMGVENAYIGFTNKIHSNERITLQDIAMGERLIQIYSENGDYDKVNELIQDVAILGTELGQQVQAMSLIKKASPEGQLQYLNKLLERVNIRENTDIKITKQQTEKILKSKNAKDLENNVSQVAIEIAQQIPLKLSDKIRAWRFLSMLGNPKTHIKNLGANLAMNLTQNLKNKVGGALEAIVNVFNPNMERTKTLKFSNKDQRQFAKQDADEMIGQLGAGGKYDIKNIIEQNKRQFDSKVLDAIAKFNSDLLESEDTLFLKIAYQQAMSNYMTANNLKSSDMQGEVLEKARQYATLQANEATFHEANAVASLINRLEQQNALTDVVVSGILPFKKTPMNIAKAGFEYSPAGLIKALGYDIGYAINKTNDYKQQLAEGKISEQQYKTETSKMLNKTIDNMAKGLTGSSITAIGMYLAFKGILKAGNDDEGDEFEEKRGSQEYAITLGDHSYTLDWVSPTAIPLFVGATIYQLATSESEDKQTALNSMFTGLSKSFEPMTEMSMLQGLTSAITSYESGSSNMLFDLGASVVTSYAGQFLPTAMGQVARTIDPYERDTSTTKKGIEGKVDRFVRQSANKIPGVSKMLPTKADVWGEEVKRDDNWLKRYAENAILPWSRKEITQDRTDKELLSVFDQTGEKTLPGVPSKDITLNSTKYRMTTEEYNQAKKDFGQTSKGIFDDLVTTKEYQGLTPEGKAKAISDVYSYAKEKIKVDYAEQQGEEYKPSSLYNTVSELEEKNGDVSAYFDFKGKLDDLDRAKGDEKVKQKEKLEYLNSMKTTDKTKTIIYKDTFGADDEVFSNLQTLTGNRISINDYLDYKTANIEGVDDPNSLIKGKKISGSKEKNVIKFLKDTNFSNIERMYIRGINNSLDTEEVEMFKSYVTKLNLTSDEKKAIYKKLKNYEELEDGRYRLK